MTPMVFGAETDGAVKVPDLVRVCTHRQDIVRDGTKV